MWVDLSHEFSGDMPHPPGTPGPEFETIRDVETEGLNETRYTVMSHVGTHVDAPLHHVPGGEAIHEIPLERFAGEGVVIDVSRDEAEEIPLSAITSADVEVREDDIVILHTGWSEHFYDHDEYLTYPWLADEIGEWLAERSIKMLALDILSPDLPGSVRPDGWMEYPVHKALLPEGILIAENLTNVGGLVGERVEAQAYPVKIRGSDGAPVRFLARRL